jgi:ABC-2 type transport system permease protein
VASVQDAAWSVGSAELLRPRARARRLVEGTAAMAQVELRKLRHDNLDIFTRSVQPLLWLFVFGSALQHVRRFSDATGVDYKAFLVPGVMAQAALFISIFFGLAIIWERDAGQLQRLLATPLPRFAIVLGKSSGAGIRALVQAVVLLAVVAIAGIELDWGVARVAAALVLLVLGTAGFACLSMMLAALLKTRERFMGIGQMVAMPLFFASSALYPLSIMPTWLQVVARANPLTYEVHGLRELLLGVGGGDPLWLDFAVIVAFFLLTAALAAKAYPRSIL